MLFIITASLMSLNLSFAYPIKPDPRFNYPHFCTEKSPELREIRYANRVAVCERKVSSSTRNRIYDKYQIPISDRGNYTIDHLIPLFMGGSNEEVNLWPQHKEIGTAETEGLIFGRLSKGEITYQEALNEILKLKLNK